MHYKARGIQVVLLCHRTNRYLRKYPQVRIKKRICCTHCVRLPLVYQNFNTSSWKSPLLDNPPVIPLCFHAEETRSRGRHRGKPIFLGECLLSQVGPAAQNSLCHVLLSMPALLEPGMMEKGGAAVPKPWGIYEKKKTTSMRSVFSAIPPRPHSSGSDSLGPELGRSCAPHTQALLFLLRKPGPGCPGGTPRS
uniref:Uncharacterized protein n=1 Tax=Molossus molossus TaxID=27622 RepID=A0A7J8DBX6_MOLMO|nr:hypothetical protein HJG59_009358 [Molossus molossus]